MGYSMWGEQAAIDALRNAGIQGDFQIGVPNYLVNKVMDEGNAGLQSILGYNRQAVASQGLGDLANTIKSNPVQQFKDISIPGMGKWSYNNGSYKFIEDEGAASKRNEIEGMLGGYRSQLGQDKTGTFATDYATQATNAAAPGAIQAMVSKGMDPTEAMAMVAKQAGEKGTLLAHDLQQNYDNQLMQMIQLLEGGLDTSKVRSMELGNSAMNAQNQAAQLQNAQYNTLGNVYGSMGTLAGNQVGLAQNERRIDSANKQADSVGNTQNYLNLASDAIAAYYGSPVQPSTVTGSGSNGTTAASNKYKLPSYEDINFGLNY
jgi:hypothetical protein